MHYLTKRLLVLIALNLYRKAELFMSDQSFFSELKQCSVGDKEFENSKFLFLMLKMGNLLDVCFLCEIVEISFTAMHKI